MKGIIVFITVLLVSVVVYPQQKQIKGEFGIHGNVVFPVDAFGESNGRDQDGYAKTGVGIGADYAFPVAPALMWITGIDILLNKCDIESVRGIKGTNWTNVPVLTGLKYQSGINPQMGVYFLAQIGLNFVKPPLFTWSDDSQTTYGPGSSFGIGVGGGLIVNKKVNIGLKYLALGEPTLSGDWNGLKFEDKQPISVFMLTIGTNLNLK